MPKDNQSPMKVACIQMRSGIDLDVNVEVYETMVREAASQGAIYILSPEMTGIVQRKRQGLFNKIYPPEADPLLKRAGELSRELGVWLHVGSTAVLIGDQMAANRAALFMPNGELAATYDKIHMFDVDLDNGESWRESKVYRPGETAVTVNAGDFTIGLSVCYDLRFPTLYQVQARAGAQILTCPAAFTRQTGRAHWHALLRARAIENGAYMIAAAQGGDHEDGRETYGHSLVVNPWGEVIAELANEEPGILLADLDLKECGAARGKVPNLKNARDFEHRVIDAVIPLQRGQVA